MVEVPLRGAALDRLDLAALCTAQPKLTFLCSPSNPVGTVIDDGDLVDALERLPGLVVVDEAYVEFSGRPSVLRWRTRFDRLVVLRTFSKAWGLAGARAGLVVAVPPILEALRTVQPTYGFGGPAQRLVAERLERPGPMRHYVDLVQRERLRLTRALERLPGARVYPSEANFLLAVLPGADDVRQRLAAGGILGRVRVGEALGLRIAVGAPEDNDRLVAALTP